MCAAAKTKLHRLPQILNRFKYIHPLVGIESVVNISFVAKMKLSASNLKKVLEVFAPILILKTG